MEWIQFFDQMYLIYFALAAVIFWGAKKCEKGTFDDSFLSYEQTKILQGIMAILIVFHHMAQKTCAPWHQPRFIVHGLDIFVDFGYFFVSVFFFCSGYGLYQSFKKKEHYLTGFLKRRVLPILLAFYLSNWIYLVIRVLLKEKMDTKKMIFYISGICQANHNAWYVLVLPLFYLFFFIGFKLFKKEGMAIFVTSACVFVYVWLGTQMNHNDYVLKGEWWYNTAIFFVIGLLFAKGEKRMIPHLKKFYYVYLILLLLCMIFGYKASVWATNEWSYYGETFHASHIVLRRWGCLLLQNVAATGFAGVLFLATMKVQLGNRLLEIFGKITLELYLMHGLFVELFGYDFADATKSLHYIKNVPIYVVVVFACSLLAAFLMKWVLEGCNFLVLGKKK